MLAIEVPSLRERASDVPLLVDAALRRICDVHGIAAPRVSDEVLELLSAQQWPGNIRELMNLLERLAIEQRTALFDPRELAPCSFAPRQFIDAPRAPTFASRAELEAHEQSELEKVRSALVEAGGNLSRTARRLEIPRSTLRHRIAKYQLGHLVPKD